MALKAVNAGDGAARTSGIFWSPGQDISVTFWGRLESADGLYHAFYSANDAAVANWLWFGIHPSGTVELFVQNSDGYLDNTEVSGETWSPEPGEWVGYIYRYHHAAGTHALYRRVSDTEVRLVGSLGGDSLVFDAGFVAHYIMGDPDGYTAGQSVAHLRMWLGLLSVDELLAELGQVRPHVTTGLLEAIPAVSPLYLDDIGSNGLDFTIAGSPVHTDGPLYPANATPEAAQLVTELPFTVTIDELLVVDMKIASDYLTTCQALAAGTMWFKYVAGYRDIELSLSLDSTEVGAMNALVSTWKGATVDEMERFTTYMYTFCSNVMGGPSGHEWVRLPVEPGETIWWKVTQDETTLVLGSDLRFVVERQPNALLPAGSVLIPSEASPFAANGISWADGKVTRVLKLPASEAAAQLTTGEILISDIDEQNLDAFTAGLYSADTLSRVATYTPPNGHGITVIFTDRTNFYVGHRVLTDSTTGLYLDKVSSGGQVTGSWLIPGAEAAQAFAISVAQGGTVLFYAQRAVLGAPIKRYDLNADAPLSNFATVAARYVRDIRAMADGTVWAVFMDGNAGIGGNATVRKFNAAGTQVASNATPSNYHHLASFDSETTVVLWGYESASGNTHAQFQRKDLATWASLTHRIETRLGGLGESAVGEQWCMTGSCPMLVVTVDVKVFDPEEPGYEPGGGAAKRRRVTPVGIGGVSDDTDCECCVATKLDMINRALAKIGVTKKVADLEEDSVEAQVGVDHVEVAIRETLESHPWAFATRYAAYADAVVSTDPMALVGGTSTAAYNADWQYAYRYPLDCVYARRLVQDTKRAYNPTPTPFRKGRHWTGQEDNDFLLLLTDDDNPTLEYTAYTKCVSDYGDPLFVDAAVTKLAELMCPGLKRTKDERENLARAFMLAIARAAQLDAGEQQQDKEGQANWILDRERW